MLPVYSPKVYKTAKGTPYLKEPGVALIAMPAVDLAGAQMFLDGFDPELGFNDYLADPVQLHDTDQLIKFAGQLCYLSLDKKRSFNEKAATYMQHIKESGHGSVLEHAQFSFLCWGIDRSVTHEAVRHRAGAAYSQVSQRYVSDAKLRFVERPEFAMDGRIDRYFEPVPDDQKCLHDMFEDWIDKCAVEYEARAQRLLQLQEQGSQLMQGDRKTDMLKKVRQAARACLPNEAEAPIVISLNGRALRHVLEMRAAAPADVQIRMMAYRMFQCVKDVAPLLFADYEVEVLKDGTFGLKTPYRKV